MRGVPSFPEEAPAPDPGAEVPIKGSSRSQPERAEARATTLLPPSKTGGSTRPMRFWAKGSSGAMAGPAGPIKTNLRRRPTDTASVLGERT